MPRVFVTKNDGSRELYSRKKLVSSLERAKANKKLIDEIVIEIERDLYDGVSTSLFYRKAHSLLKRKENKVASKYSMRRSLLNLGPSGFPFEKFMAHIYKTKGYKTKAGITMQGKCSTHEIDVIAYNDKELIVGEAKFHNQLGLKTDTKVALYIKARFDDLKAKSHKLDGKERKVTKGLLVTNTKFTDNAINFLKCSGGIDILSWDYPKENNLYDLIEETNIHPMTCMPLLSKKEKQDLLAKGIVDCIELKNKKNTMREIGIPESKINQIVSNIDSLCSHGLN